MKVVNRSPLIAILLTVTLFGIFLLAQILNQDQLFGIQPHVHRFFTDFGESDQLFNQRVTIYNGELVLPDTSFLRTITYIVGQGGAIDSFALFEYAPVLVSMLYTLLIMMIVIAMTKRVQYALVTGLIVYTSPFFVYRAPFFVPENVAILFVLSMIWGFERYRKTGQIIFMLMVILSILGIVFYHPSAILIAILIIISYTLQFLFNEEPRKIEVTFLSVLVTLILLLPMFGTLLNVLTTTFTTFGDNALWGEYVGGNALEPTVNNFFAIVGYPLSIFALLGIVAIIRRSWKEYLHLLVMLAGILLLMLNLSPQISLSPARLQLYLHPVLVLISAVYVSLLFRRTSRLVRMMLISTLITFGIATMLDNPPWERIRDPERAMLAEVNDILVDSPDDKIYVEADAMMLTPMLRHPSQICVYWEPVFQWYVPPSSGDVPDCTRAAYRLALTGRNLPDYRIVRQTDRFSLYERIVDS